jgi:hypothetical protein
MKFLAVASTLLLAGSAVAAPGTAKRFENHARRKANSRSNGLMHHVTGPETETSGNKFVEYSSNWAGAILIGSGYTSVTGTVSHITHSFRVLLVESSELFFKIIKCHTKR